MLADIRDMVHSDSMPEWSTEIMPQLMAGVVSSVVAQPLPVAMSSAERRIELDAADCTSRCSAAYRGRTKVNAGHVDSSYCDESQTPFKSPYEYGIPHETHAATILEVEFAMLCRLFCHYTLPLTTNQRTAIALLGCRVNPSMS